MQCKFCGSEMESLQVMNYPLAARPGAVQNRYDFYCMDPACGASYTYSLMNGNEIMDRHWYDPDPHPVEDPEAPEAPEAPAESQEVPGGN